MRFLLSLDSGFGIVNYKKIGQIYFIIKFKKVFYGNTHKFLEKSIDIKRKRILSGKISFESSQKFWISLRNNETNIF